MSEKWIAVLKKRQSDLSKVSQLNLYSLLYVVFALETIYCLVYNSMN